MRLIKVYVPNETSNMKFVICNASLFFFFFFLTLQAYCNHIFFSFVRTLTQNLKLLIPQVKSVELSTSSNTQFQYS